MTNKFSESELARCLNLLSEKFPSDHSSIQWLTLAHPLLANQTPLQVMADGNVKAVIQLLEKLEAKLIS